MPALPAHTHVEAGHRDGSIGESRAGVDAAEQPGDRSVEVRVESPDVAQLDDRVSLAEVFDLDVPEGHADPIEPLGEAQHTIDGVGGEGQQHTTEHRTPQARADRAAGAFESSRLAACAFVQKPEEILERIVAVGDAGGRERETTGRGVDHETPDRAAGGQRGEARVEIDRAPRRRSLERVVHGDRPRRLYHRSRGRVHAWGRAPSCHGILSGMWELVDEDEAATIGRFETFGLAVLRAPVDVAFFERVGRVMDVLAESERYSMLIVRAGTLPGQLSGPARERALGLMKEHGDHLNGFGYVLSGGGLKARMLRGAMNAVLKTAKFPAKVFTDPMEGVSWMLDQRGQPASLREARAAILSEVAQLVRA